MTKNMTKLRLKWSKLTKKSSIKCLVTNLYKKAHNETYQKGLKLVIID